MEIDTDGSPKRTQTRVARMICKKTSLATSFIIVTNFMTDVETNKWRAINQIEC